MGIGEVGAGQVAADQPAAAPAARAVRNIADVGAGDHLCCLYESEDERRATLVPFVRQGLERGEKVVLIAGADATERIHDWLRDDGFDDGPHRSRGQIVTLVRDETSLRDGLFDPVAMYGLTRAEIEKGAAEGYAVVRVAEDRTWALRGLPSSVRLTEYERQLDAQVRADHCLALCLYDRAKFEPATLLDVLPAHAWAVVGAEVCENLRYQPADDLPSSQRPAAELKRWIRSMVERARAQEALTQERFLMHTLMDNIPDNIYFKDKDSRFIRISRALADQFGLANPAEAVGKSDFDFFTEEHAKQAYDDEQAIIAQGKPINKEEKETWADRADTWVSTTKVPLRDEAGRSMGTFGISRDITARKVAEAESARLIGELQEALWKVKGLSDLLPVCSSCRKVRDDQAYRDQIAQYLEEHADVELGHGLCPDCARKADAGAKPS